MSTDIDLQALGGANGHAALAESMDMRIVKLEAQLEAGQSGT